MKREIEPVSIRSIPSKQLAHAINYVTVDTIFFSPVLLLLHHHLHIVKWMREKGSQWMNTETRSRMFNIMSENEIDWCGSREPLRPESRTRISRPNRIWQRKNNNNNNHIVERTMWMKDKKKNSRWLNCMCGWIQKLRSIYVALLHCRNCCRIIKCITKFYGMQKSDQRRRSSLREIHRTLARAHTRARKLFRRRPYVWQCNFERNVCYEMRSLIFFERTTEPEPHRSQKNRKSAVTHASHESRVGDGCARCF